MSGGRSIASGQPARKPPSAHVARIATIALLLALVAVLLLPPGASAAPSGPPPSAPALPAERAVTGPSDAGTPGWTTLRGAENRSGFSPFDGPTSGNLLWQKAVSSYAILAGPLISGNRVYIADELGGVAALNQSANGSVLWRSSVGVAPTTPDLSGNALFFGDGGGNVTALSATNGSLLWKRAVGAAVVLGVAVDSGAVIAATVAGRVVALGAANGTPLWSASVPGSIVGAIAWDGSSGFVVNSTGTVFRIDTGGAVPWSAPLGDPTDAGAAVFGGTVYVADASANVSALSAANGSLLWRYHDPEPGDLFQSAPSIGDGLVVATSEEGFDYGLSAANGSVEWTHTTTPQGYPVLAGSVIAPNGVYAIDAGEQVGDYSPLTGNPLWLASTGTSVSFTPPALYQDQLVVGDQVGYVFDFGLAAAEIRYPVSGHVGTPSGAPLAGASVAAPGVGATTSANGSFTVYLPNGSYLFNVSALGYPPALFPVVVNGVPIAVRFVLQPLAVYPLEGQVVDADSMRPLAGANVTVIGSYGFMASNTTNANGDFFLLVPNGSDYFTVAPPTGYHGLAERISISAGLATTSGGVVLGLATDSLTPPSSDPYNTAVLIGVVAAGIAALVAGLGWRARRKGEQGLGTSILTPFERFLAMRGILIVPQIVAVLLLLYVFGTFLPAAALDEPLCSIYTSGCSNCTWSNFGCVAWLFLEGLWAFLVNMFTGNWGIASYGNLRAPASAFVQWWAPYSIELAVVAFAIAALVAYPLGLYSGWRPDRPVDSGTRVLSITALLVPSFLVVLLILGAVYLPFYHTFGDEPYGIIPSANWFVMNGGVPLWVGEAGNTSPTGYPLIDGLVHQDWSFEALTLAKTLLQAALIALVFIAIFLRFARHTVAEAAGQPNVVAARSRGVPERRLLWQHTGRRVLPLFILILGLTIPIYIGTQALVEAMFNDPGLGTLLLAEMTNVSTTRFGFSSLSGVHPGNIYQVAVFFTALVVLIASLCADIVARLLDPRLASTESA